ncbi:UNVERIFIED_CONTAM: hypothetical protein HDU68_012250 [Siphonaria sp. JEL0065]|nr:hypothetical protein HDU68_012250 [Siphonaria sp. JEL0065]
MKYADFAAVAVLAVDAVLAVGGVRRVFARPVIDTTPVVEEVGIDSILFVVLFAVGMVEDGGGEVVEDDEEHEDSDEEDDEGEEQGSVALLRRGEFRDPSE